MVGVNEDVPPKVFCVSVKEMSPSDSKGKNRKEKEEMEIKSRKVAKSTIGSKQMDQNQFYFQASTTTFYYTLHNIRHTIK